MRKSSIGLDEYIFYGAGYETVDKTMTKNNLSLL